MSEQLRHVEHENQPEHGHEAEAKRPEVSVEREQHKQHEQLEHAKKVVEQHAKTKEDTPVESGTHRNEQPLYVNQELKTIALHRTLARIRRHLSAPDRLLSKAVHQPTVQAVSEAGAKTVARPSGLLFGSLTALIGSSLALYLAKHYGFHYNYALVFALFIGGFAVGLVIEFVWWLLQHRRVNL